MLGISNRLDVVCVRASRVALRDITRIRGLEQAAALDRVPAARDLAQRANAVVFGPGTPEVALRAAFQSTKQPITPNNTENTSESKLNRLKSTMLCCSTFSKLKFFCK